MSKREERAAERSSGPVNPVAIIRYERARQERQEQQRQALEMRRAGASYRQIAEVQGCRPGTVVNRVRKAIAREIPQELIDSTRAIELDRIDQMTQMNLVAMTQAFNKGDMETYLKIQDRVNALHDRRARIVPIQQPTKLVIDQAANAQIEQDRELTELIGDTADKIQAKINFITEVSDRALG